MFTNAEIGTLIDALEQAIDDTHSSIDSFLPPRRSAYEQKDRAQHAEWSANIRRYRALRRKLLALEKRALRRFRKAA